MNIDAYWVSLMSGGKDSSWALYQAREQALPVSQLLTARPADDSYLFHVPALSLTPYIAESIGLPLHTFPVSPPSTDDASDVGDAELEELQTALRTLDNAVEGSLAGVVTGAVESQFQYDRVSQLCAELGIDQFSPLWQCDPEPALRAMLDAGFDIHIVGVAAEGLDQSWLGRQLDDDAISDLLGLHEQYGLHLMGEGGEYETVVVDGPHLEAPIRYKAEPHWDGTRGYLRITDAWLDT